MTITCITANLARRPAALKALAALTADLLFIQEAPRELPRGFHADYAVTEYRPTAANPAYLCRSLVATRRASHLTLRGMASPNAPYHRSYVATAVLELPKIGSTTVVSVHASPTIIGPRSTYLQDWSQPLPRPRAVSAGERWDADFLLATIARLRKNRPGPLLIAGDLNEARDGTTYESAWADEWIARAESIGLTDVTMKAWGKEIPTHKRAQVDHVLATIDVATHISSARVLDDIGSDHLAIEFTIS